MEKNIFYYWNGPKISERYERNSKRMQIMNPDRKVQVVDDDFCLPLIKKISPKLYELYADIKIPAARSDCSRLACLYEHGGWYLDFDMYLRTSIDYWEEDSKDLYLQRLVQPNGKVTSPNSMMGGRARHPFFKGALEYIAATLEGKYSHYSVFNATGPTAVLAASGAYIKSPKTFFGEMGSGFIDINGDDTKGSWTFQESCGIWANDASPTKFNDSSPVERLGGKKGTKSLDYYIKRFDEFEVTRKDNYRKMLNKLAMHYIVEHKLGVSIAKLVTQWFDNAADKKFIETIASTLKDNNEKEGLEILKGSFQWLNVSELIGV
ncbi:TPA: glycosyltransferase family 32 protein [Citrobacter freundii]